MWFFLIDFFCLFLHHPAQLLPHSRKDPLEVALSEDEVGVFSELYDPRLCDFYIGLL